MGTRSRIAVENDDGSFTSIYCHWDGYPSHVGATLNEHYKEPAKVNALMALGNVSSLAAELGTKHDFDGAPKSQCNFYGRDRGETQQEAEQSPNEAALRSLAQESGAEWLYLFRRGQWLGAGGAFSAFGMPANQEVGDFETIETLLIKENSDD